MFAMNVTLAIFSGMWAPFDMIPKLMIVLSILLIGYIFLLLPWRVLTEENAPAAMACMLGACFSVSVLLD